MNNMKKYFLLCCVLMFAQIGFASDKIGVVDIQKLVNNSNAVRMLKQEHNSQMQSLNSIITEAQSAISKENDPQKIIALQDKYNSEFNKRKEIIDSQYKARLSAIEDSLRKDIIKSAKNNNYDFVIAKSMVFYGGDDITDIVSKDLR